jgi:ribonuclease R
MNKEEILHIFKDIGKPLKFNEIADILHLKTKKERIEIKRILKKLLKKGKIHITKSHTYCLSDEANLIKGKVEFNPAGFAFLIPEKEFESSDIFLKPGTLLEAIDGDTVLVRIDKYKKNGKPEGSIVKILERGLKNIVGIFQKSKDFGFVVPLNKRVVRDFYIPKDKFKNAKNGDVVNIKIIRYPSKSHNPVGEIVKVLGKPEKESTILSTINLKYKIKEKFPSSVKKEAALLSSKEYKVNTRRKNLTNIKFFTIDGMKARDFDDAVAIIKEKDNFRLFVSIADVEFFVKENSVIDREAYERSTSVYYPNMVNPMLPEVLSNDLCSLNPNEDKFTFTVEMLINSGGDVIDANIYKSIIKSKFRATYEEIGDIFEKNDNILKNKYKSILPDIEIMTELSEILRKKRFQKGSIDFNLPEVEIEFGEDGKVANIKKVKRNMAHILIEEFMLLANETVATYLSKRDVPLLYRVHEFPDEEKLSEIGRFLYHVGINIKIKSAKDIQNVLKKVENQPYEKLINYLFLRAMKQARYSPENTGHFALAKENYTHFTSPIRRYPDLVNHRILRRAVNKKITTKYIDKLNNKLGTIASYTSEKERMAADAEREVVDWKKMEFMENKFDIPFEGTITGVTSFGIFVEINDILVEGMVPIRNLTDDYYTFVEQDYMVRGKRRGNFYRLGDQVKVQLEKIDKLNRKIDFILLEKIDDHK